MRSSETSLIKAFAATFKGEGMRGFFKGMMSPIVSNIPYNSVVFTTFEVSRRLIGGNYPGISKEAKSFIAGSIAGGVSVLTFCPVDLMKVRAQANR